MTPAATRRDSVSRRAWRPHPIPMPSRPRRQPARTMRLAGTVHAAALAAPVRAEDPAVAEVRNAAFDRLACTREPGWLAAFIRRAWPIIEPRPLVWSWHMTLLCVELERVAAGLTRELVISVPPGTAKSLIVSALFPAALWLRDPSMQVLAIAHVPKNVTRDAVRHRDVVTSRWYRGLVERLAKEEGIGLVPDADGALVPWTLKADQNEKINFQNTASGSREVGSVGGGITGTRCQGLITDDCYNAKDATDGTPAQVAERMAYVVDQYDSNWKNRVHPIDGWRVNIMQGLAEGDLADVLVRRGVRRLVLPMEYEPGVTVTVTRPGCAPVEEPLYHPRDPRTKPGELLFPALFSAGWCAEFKATAAGLRIWGPQYQQRRSSVGGALFPRAWFSTTPVPDIGVRRYQGAPERIARGLDVIGLSVDCTFKDTKSSDRVSIQAWGWKEGLTHRFLLDRVAARMDIMGTMSAIVAMRAKWNALIPGRALVRVVLVEDKANGPAVISLLSGQVAGLIGYTPRGSKYARAQITSYQIQAGAIWYPMPEFAPWAHEVAEQHVAFTGAEGGVDDDIDAESQMVIYLDDAGAQKPDDALARITGRMGFLGAKR